MGGKDNRDAHGLSAKKPHMRLWNSVRTTTKDVDTLGGVRPGTHTCKYGDISTLDISSSAVYLIGREFKPLRGLIQGVQTIVLTLVDMIIHIQQ